MEEFGDDGGDMKSSNDVMDIHCNCRLNNRLMHVVLKRDLRGHCLAVKYHLCEILRGDVGSCQLSYKKYFKISFNKI
jgi:hypothetical protein